MDDEVLHVRPAWPARVAAALAGLGLVAAALTSAVWPAPVDGHGSVAVPTSPSSGPQPYSTLRGHHLL